MPSQMRIARLLKDNERIPIMRKQLQLESSAKAPNVAVKVNKKLLLTVQGFLFVWNTLKIDREIQRKHDYWLDTNCTPEKINGLLFQAWLDQTYPSDALLAPHSLRERVSNV